MQPDRHAVVLAALDQALRSAHVDVGCRTVTLGLAEWNRLVLTIDPRTTDAADQAGQEVISVGAHKGKTIAEIASHARGPAWIRWCLLAGDHPATPYAAAYARAFLPDVYAEAMHELRKREAA